MSDQSKRNSGAESARNLGIFAYSPIGGAVIGFFFMRWNSPCNPVGQSLDDPYGRPLPECTNFLGFNPFDLVGKVEPLTAGAVGGLIILVLAGMYVLMKTGSLD